MNFFAIFLFTLCLIDLQKCSPICCKNKVEHSDFLLTFKCKLNVCQSGNVSEACISCVPRRISDPIKSLEVTCGELSTNQKLRVILSWQSPLPRFFIIEYRNQSTYWLNQNSTANVNPDINKFRNLSFSFENVAIFNNTVDGDADRDASKFRNLAKDADLDPSKFGNLTKDADRDPSKIRNLAKDADRDPSKFRNITKDADRDAFEFRNLFSKWKYVGLTSETSAEIADLEFGVYQFRVVPTDFHRSAMSTGWVRLDADMGLVTNLTVEEFGMRDKSVDAVVKWDAPHGAACINHLVWYSSESDQKEIKVVQASTKAILPSLSFDTEYRIKIESNGKKFLAKITTPAFLIHWLPLNISVHWATKSQLILNWSSVNQSSSAQYHVTVLEKDFLHPLMHTIVNSSKAVFDDLDSSKSYLVTVRNIFSSKASTIKIPPYTPSNNYQFRSSSPYYYIIPAGVLLLLVLGAILLKPHCKGCKKTSRSGMSDVSGDLQPFIVKPEDVLMLEEIGRGAYGVVHRGLHFRNRSKTTVAIKVFETHSKHLLLREASMLRLVVRHDHILQLKGICLSRGLLLTEYCEGGSLLGHLGYLRKRLIRMKSHPRPDDEKGHWIGRQLCVYIHQVCKALSHITSLKLVHRDVASRNVLLKSDLRTAVLGDFGLARDIYEKGNYSGMTVRPLPIRWMAPEALHGQKFCSRTDVWSFGVLMWEIFKLGKKPYSALQNEHVLPFLEMGYRLQKPHCTQQWYDLMLQCWCQYPRQRPRFKELVQKTGVLVDAMDNYIPLALPQRPTQVNYTELV